MTKTWGSATESTLSKFLAFREIILLKLLWGVLLRFLNSWPSALQRRSVTKVALFRDFRARENTKPMPSSKIDSHLQQFGGHTSDHYQALLSGATQKSSLWTLISWGHCCRKSGLIVIWGRGACGCRWRKG